MMLKTTMIYIALLTALPPPYQTSDQAIDLLSGKIQVLFQERGWWLKHKQIRQREAYQHWESNLQSIELTFFYFSSKEEAVKHLEQDRDITLTGVGELIRGIGDEAFEWNDMKGGKTAIRFRKGRVMVTLIASSAELARKYAEIVSDYVESNAVR
jgi:hypothetical protein